MASLSADQVLSIAQADALQAYGDLSPYRIQLVLEPDGWHIDYELKEAKLKGGGPHYVIDASSGANSFEAVRAVTGHFLPTGGRSEAEMRLA